MNFIDTIYAHPFWTMIFMTTIFAFLHACLATYKEK